MQTRCRVVVATEMVDNIALLLATKREFMIVTSKLANNLANGSPKLSRNRRNPKFGSTDHPSRGL